LVVANGFFTFRAILGALHDFLFEVEFLLLEGSGLRYDIFDLLHVALVVRSLLIVHSEV